VVVNSGQIIMARTLDGADWSAPETIVVSDDLADNTSLAVSELMYNPAPLTAADIAAGFNDSDLFEYAEVLNIAAHPIALVGVEFVDGIEFDFNSGPMTFLLPGERALVVKNRAAFEHRYGNTYSDRIVGEFANDTNLRNSGEQLVLNALDGGPLRDFAYDDEPPWPTAADGSGRSLVLIAPDTNPDHAVASNWRSSVAVGGSPGYSDTTTWTDWSAAHGGVGAGSDHDRDARDAMSEYGLGGDPDLADSDKTNFILSTRSIDVGGVVDGYLMFVIPRNLAADDVDITPQNSTDLQVWTDASADMVFMEESNHGDGTASLLYRSALPSDQLPAGSSWYRLLLTLR